MFDLGRMVRTQGTRCLQTMCQGLCNDGCVDEDACEEDTFSAALAMAQETVPSHQDATGY